MTDTSPNADLVPTPNDCPLPRKLADFATFNDAVDYAAQSEKGLNFHDMRGTLVQPYPYSEMREDALAMAYRLIASGVQKEDRIALIAETGPDFAALFCACSYVGAWPVPLPLPTTFGGREFLCRAIVEPVAKLRSQDADLPARNCGDGCCRGRGTGMRAVSTGPHWPSATRPIVELARSKP